MRIQPYRSSHLKSGLIQFFRQAEARKSSLTGDVKNPFSVRKNYSWISMYNFMMQMRVRNMDPIFF